MRISGHELLVASPLSVAQWSAWLTAAGVPATARQTHSLESNPGFVDFANDDYHLSAHGQAVLTAANTGGPVGCYITGTEEVGLRANPTC